MSEYGLIPERGDHFYVRANFSYDGGENDGEMTVAHGDLLLVENSLVNGQFGKWFAHKVDLQDKKLQHGIIPSRTK